MKIIIFGATGQTGRQLVEHALAQGHVVTAFARKPESIVEKHAHLRIAQGDILDALSVERAVEGQEAVLSALGVRDRKDGSTVSTGTRHILGAMAKHGVRRIIVQSSVGVGESRRQAGVLFGRIIVPLFLKTVFADKERQENLVRLSGLDWTIVRPTGLTDKPARRRYKVETSDLPVPSWIARADVAEFMVAELERRQYVRKALAIGG